MSVRSHPQLMSSDRPHSASVSWLHVALGFGAAPVLAGLLAHQRVQQWLADTTRNSVWQDGWQDQRLPTLERPPVPSDMAQSDRLTDGTATNDPATNSP